jgi:phosphoenolpyruvate carboxykinase (GTP)
MGSEMTAAAVGGAGQVRRDPMAMLPFCGYNMGDYFSHWLGMRKRIKYPPQIFHVNWFRKGAEGKFLWPGFGENMRVLKWIIDRVKGRIPAHETQVGWSPRYQDFQWEGLDYSATDFEAVQSIEIPEWQRELGWQDELFFKLSDRLPKELVFQRELLVSRL